MTLEMQLKRMTRPKSLRRVERMRRRRRRSSSRRRRKKRKWRRWLGPTFDTSNGLHSK